MAAYDNRAFTVDDFATIRLEEKKVRFEIFSINGFILNTIRIQANVNIYHCKATTTRHLGKWHRVPVFLHRLIRGIRKRMAIPIRSLGEWWRSLPHPLHNRAVRGWSTDLLPRNDNWAILQPRSCSAVRFLSGYERYRSHTDPSHLLRRDILLGFMCHHWLLLREFLL